MRDLLTASRRDEWPRLLFAAYMAGKVSQVLYWRDRLDVAESMLLFGPVGQPGVRGCLDDLRLMGPFDGPVDEEGRGKATFMCAIAACGTIKQVLSAIPIMVNRMASPQDDSRDIEKRVKDVLGHLARFDGDDAAKIITALRKEAGKQTRAALTTKDFLIGRFLFGLGDDHVVAVRWAQSYFAGIMPLRADPVPPLGDNAITRALEWCDAQVVSGRPERIRRFASNPSFVPMLMKISMGNGSQRRRDIASRLIGIIAASAA
jgi:hypothetical protein